jgi:hypothetical protein
MQSDVQRLTEEYRRLIIEYIDAIHKQEMARLEALPYANDDKVVKEWLRACAAAEEINTRRLEAQCRLRKAFGYEKD